MQPHGHAKNFIDCARFWLLNAKMNNLTLFNLFWVLFVIFLGALAHFVCANFFDTHFGRPKKFTFIKSGSFRIHVLIVVTFQEEKLP